MFGVKTSFSKMIGFSCLGALSMLLVSGRIEKLTFAAVNLAGDTIIPNPYLMPLFPPQAGSLGLYKQSPSTRARQTGGIQTGFGIKLNRVGYLTADNDSDDDDDDDDDDCKTRKANYSLTDNDRDDDDDDDDDCKTRKANSFINSPVGKLPGGQGAASRI